MTYAFSQVEQQFLVTWAFVFTVFIVASVVAYSALLGRRK